MLPAMLKIVTHVVDTHRLQSLQMALFLLKSNFGRDRHSVRQPAMHLDPVPLTNAGTVDTAMVAAATGLATLLRVLAAVMARWRLQLKFSAFGAIRINLKMARHKDALEVHTSLLLLKQKKKQLQRSTLSAVARALADIMGARWLWSLKQSLLQFIHNYVLS